MSREIKQTYLDKLNRPLIIAHRGASAYAPENTLAAFNLAVDQHADGIELDAQLSSDGQVVVMHDDTVDRTTNGTGRVNSLTLTQLEHLDAGAKFPPLFKSEKVPSLEDVFEALGRKLVINVELKNYLTPTDDLPEKVAALIRKFNLEEKVILSSFNFFALIRARRILQDVPLGLLTIPGFAEASLRFRLIRFGPLLSLHPHFQDVTPALVQMAHQANCRIHTFTVNEAEMMKKMITLGVDGIITPDPLMARRILSEADR